MTLKFSIIGCGRIAERHAEHIHRLGELVGVCDIVEARARQLAARYEVTAFDNIEALLNHSREAKVDVVAICTPNGLHAEHAIKALRAGFHVVCEKPMALTVADCRRMISAADTAGRKLFVVKQNRFNPPVAAVKKLIEENRLGRIFSIQLNCFWNRDASYYQDSWRGTADLDGGTLFTQFSHYIDLVYWLLGELEEMQGYVGNFNHKDCIAFEDTGVIAARFRNGTIGTIHYTVNSHRRNMEGSLTIFGEKGTVKIGGEYLNELEYQDIAGYVIGDLPPGNPPNRYGHYQGSMSNHDKVYLNVIEAINGREDIATNGLDGLKTVEIIQKIYSSVRKL
jgi:predicted dehydrogenase